MIAIQIKTELVEWVQERLDLDADEAQNFAEEFAGMLYFSGGFPAEAGRPKEAAPALLAALTDPIPDGKGKTFADNLDVIAGLVGHLGYDWTEWAIREKAQAIRAAIAQARGE